MKILCVFIFSIIVNKLRSTVKIFDHKHRFNRLVRRNFERDYEHGQQNSLQHVRQDIFESQPACQAYADSHWWGAAQMWTVQQIIQSS